LFDILFEGEEEDVYNFMSINLRVIISRDERDTSKHCSSRNRLLLTILCRAF